MQETSNESAASATQLALVNEIEARILGCLIEKAATTPDVYPLTLNAVVLACNQKSNREPLMNLEPGAVGHALRLMEDRGLVRVAPGSSRALRYEHMSDKVYVLTPRQRALLCVMLLRGPQTLNELWTRSERLAQFPDLDELRSTVERLCERTPALSVRIARGPGQREDRYMHLLCGAVASDRYNFSDRAPAPGADDSRGDRIELLEQRVEKLETELAELRERLQAASTGPI